MLCMCGREGSRGRVDRRHHPTHTTVIGKRRYTLNGHKHDRQTDVYTEAARGTGSASAVGHGAGCCPSTLCGPHPPGSWYGSHPA